jgi:hypothetical protein
LSSKTHEVEIPELYLLILAVHGNMGDGEIPGLMKAWARGECERLELREELMRMQNERVRELRDRILKVEGGKELVAAVDKTIKDVLGASNDQSEEK